MVEVIVELIDHLLVKMLETNIDVLLNVLLALQYVLKELFCLLGDVRELVVLAAAVDISVPITLQLEVGDAIVDVLRLHDVVVVPAPLLVFKVPGSPPTSF